MSKNKRRNFSADFKAKVAIEAIKEKATYERVKMIEWSKDSMSITHQCHLLNLFRSRLYYKPSEQENENSTLMQELDRQYLKTPFY